MLTASRLVSRSYSRWLVPVLGLALALPMTTLRAEEPAKATGTISGKVVGEDGAVAADLAVRVMVAPPAKGEKKPKAVEPGGGGGDKPGAGGGEKPGKGNKPTPVAETKTDASGAFKVAVPAGEYVVTAGDRKAGISGRERVKVADGESATVSITVKKMEPGQGGGGKKPKN